MKTEVLLLVIGIALILSCSKEKKADKAGEKMQEFVMAIADYARKTKSGFIVIPQNGAELAFKNLDPNEGEHHGYMAAISGLGIEELFYNGGYAPDPERLSMLQKLVGSKPILVAEYISDKADVDKAIQLNLDEGFLCFPRSASIA